MKYIDQFYTNIIAKMKLKLKLLVELGADRDTDDMQSDINKIVETWCET